MTLLAVDIGGRLYVEDSARAGSDPLARFLAMMSQTCEVLETLTGAVRETLDGLEVMLASLGEWDESGLDEFHPDTTHNPGVEPAT